MLYTNTTSFRENLSDLFQFNESIHISTNAGNAVLISEKGYNSPHPLLDFLPSGVDTVDKKSESGRLMR